MKKIYSVIALFVLMMTAVSCTEQSMKRNFGGKMSIKLPKGERLLTATWKEADLFYLTEPMDSDYIPKNKKFVESSSFGVWESEITFIETK